ncbi:aminotransferase class V-fold PLP-dependent enzyme [Candidatus Vidania fulgoroideorum]
MNKIYLDNASTTKISNYVLKKINKSYKIYNNSFSNSFFYNKSKNILNNYRYKISKILFCKRNEIFFTSGCTESNNIAIRGILKKKYIFITSNIEHSSITNIFKNLKIKKKKINNKNGVYCLKELNKYIKKYEKKKILVSLTWINNETGIIQNIKKICNICKKKNIFLHIDASQVIGKYKINLRILNIDFLNFSSHKIHGPGGIGVLYIKKNIFKKLKPIIFGGNQEKNIRPGTIYLPLVVGLGESIIRSYKKLKKNKKKIKKLNKFFIKKNKKFIKINGSGKKTPYIINFYMKKINRNYFSYKLRKFFFSFNSSCNNKKYSKILKNMKLKKNIYKNSIRISFSKYNNIFELKILSKKIKKIYFFFKNYLL